MTSDDGAQLRGGPNRAIWLVFGPIYPGWVADERGTLSSSRRQRPLTHQRRKAMVVRHVVE
jgi:hypothetical protein